MSKDVKQVIIIWLAAVLAGIFCFVYIGKAMAATSQCPIGSYEIGFKDDSGPLCKLEPTGCPYGDSIPLGPLCDKQAPQITPDVVPAPAEPIKSGEVNINYEFEGK